MLYKKKWPLLVFLIPGFFLMLMFLYKPFIENIINSFYNMTSPVKMPGKELNFIGLDNYSRLFKDSMLQIAIKNSFIMMVLTVVFEVGVAFVLATLVSQIKRGQHIFRTIYFFPVVISATAIGLMFKLFYNLRGGALNQILDLFGKEPVYWLGDKLAFPMISIPILWSYVGFYFVIMLTGLSDISDDVYEAASIDGCSKFKQVFYITIPLLRGVICTCVTLAVTGALKVFDLPWVIAEGGAPNGLTHFLGTYMYDQAWNVSDFDYAAALAVVIVILGIIVSKVTSRLIRPEANM